MKPEKFWTTIEKYPWLLHAIGSPYDEIESEIRRKGSLGIETLGLALCGGGTAPLWKIIKYIAVRPFSSLPLKEKATCQFAQEGMEDWRGGYLIHTGKVTSYLFYWHQPEQRPFSECTKLDGWEKPSATVEETLNSLLNRSCIIDAVVRSKGTHRSAELLPPNEDEKATEENFMAALARWQDYQKGLGDGGGLSYNIYFPLPPSKEF